jgi:hypothetical protein
LLIGIFVELHGALDRSVATKARWGRYGTTIPYIDIIKLKWKDTD